MSSAESIAEKLKTNKSIAEIQKKINKLEKNLTTARARFNKDPLDATQWYPDEIPLLTFQFNTYKQAIDALEEEASIDFLIDHLTRRLIFLAQRSLKCNRMEAIELAATGECIEFLTDIRSFHNP